MAFSYKTWLLGNSINLNMYLMLVSYYKSLFFTDRLSSVYENKPLYYPIFNALGRLKHYIKLTFYRIYLC